MENNIITIYRIETLEPIWQYKTQKNSWPATFSPDGTHILWMVGNKKEYSTYVLKIEPQIEAM